MAQHGTYAGWNQHQKEQTEICLACREASRQYQMAHRADPENRKKHRLDIKARRLAYQRLAKMHPYEYATLYDEEKAKLTRG
jgi:hypothetical protein